VADLVAGEAAAEERLFAVGEPFLENLIAAEGVAPDRLGDIAPEGRVVEVDVQRGVPGSGFRVQGILSRPDID